MVDVDMDLGQDIAIPEITLETKGRPPVKPPPFPGIVSRDEIRTAVSGEGKAFKRYVFSVRPFRYTLPDGRVIGHEIAGKWGAWTVGMGKALPISDQDGSLMMRLMDSIREVHGSRFAIQGYDEQVKLRAPFTGQLIGLVGFWEAFDVSKAQMAEWRGRKPRPGDEREFVFERMILAQPWPQGIDRADVIMTALELPKYVAPDSISGEGSYISSAPSVNGNGTYNAEPLALTEEQTALLKEVYVGKRVTDAVRTVTLNIEKYLPIKEVVYQNNAGLTALQAAGVLTVGDDGVVREV